MLHLKNEVLLTDRFNDVQLSRYKEMVVFKGGLAAKVVVDVQFWDGYVDRPTITTRCRISHRQQFNH